MTRRSLFGLAAGVGVAAVVGERVRSAYTWGETSVPRAGEQPRAWFFRQAEVVDKYDDFDSWANQFRCLNGIQGKVFSEEIDQVDEKAQKWFSRFRRENPDQVVLLHFNGKGRRPGFQSGTFFPGHWLYYAGTTVTRRSGPMARKVRVEDTSVFSMRRLGKNDPDDVVIVPPDDDGLDWLRAEHARLVGLDEDTRTLTLRRGSYGTEPVEVPPGSYVAPHVKHRPPKLPESATLWMYNFNGRGPRDSDGRTCGEALAAELGGHLGKEGALAAFDGVEFDVLFFAPDGDARFVVDQEKIDVDNDGRADGGLVDGHNVYGDGVTAFCADLRRRLPDKLLMADGMIPEAHQRSFGVLNGMESEGFPVLNDPDFAGWSDGLNRHEFWRTRGADPVTNYVVFKYVRDENMPGADPDAYKRLRLALAAAVYTDAAFAQGSRWAPPEVGWREGGGVEVQVFDELWRGKDQRRNWLGRPTDAAEHLALQAPDLFDGEGANVDWSKAEPAGTSGDTGVPMRSVPLGSVEVRGHDLVVALAMSARQLADYPRNARRIAVRATPAAGEAKQVLAWADEDESTSTHAFRDVGPGRVDLALVVEGTEDASVERLTAHDHPDAMCRRFVHGLVLANPSGRPYEFDVGELGDGERYRRIRGTSQQDPRTNDGSAVAGTVTVGPLDALFLVATR